MPDPTWPPAPPGWDYWVDDQPTVRPARPELPTEATTVMAPVPAVAPPPPAAPAPPAPPAPTVAPTVGPLGGSLDAGRESTSPVSAALRTVGDKLRDAGDRRTSRRAQREQDAAAAAAGPSSRAGARSPRGRQPGALVAGVAVACLAFGCILGVTFSMMRSSDAAQALVDAKRQVAAAEEIEAEAKQAQEDLTAQQAAVQKREEALKEREKAAEAQETELASQKKAFEDQQAQHQQQQQQEQQQQDSAWFYWDCNAARQAGSAPIQNGQPAYRGALDPNGNGIACEDGE
ncbi:excalibur calcium-binding domain-containing protein [Isoptericola sp. 4D.3]|uniref:Excalibur calcium-binding domain-containing protein n=1 Tax=Isoptericola peretonis TaxID=2918523 RepID=A0ABT0J4E6_9MICO|nr:excalibur calcium-binding domain-containing protein [Isoptericola sp. 4D.3]